MDYREDFGYESTMTALGDEGNLRPLEDVMAYLREYARERPEAMALTCLAIGFILGWKLKPW